MGQGLERVNGQCSVPQWQTMAAEELFTNDDLLPLVAEIGFVRGKVGSAGWRSVVITDDGWKPSGGFGVNVHYDGASTLVVTSNNLGYAPQMFTDTLGVSDASFSDSHLLVRLSLCGMHSEVTLAAAEGPSTSVNRTHALSAHYNQRLPVPPANFSFVVGGTFRSLRLQRRGAERCWRYEDLVATSPATAEYFVDDCSGSGAMWGGGAKLAGAWHPRFARIGGAEYSSGECVVEQHQFALLFKHFFAVDAPLLLAVWLTGAGGIALSQDPRLDGFNLPFGIGLTVQVSGSAVELQSNNLGYAPQTVTNVVQVAPPLRLVVLICGQRSMAWATPGSANDPAANETLTVPQTAPFHDASNWRFRPELPWMLKLTAGRTRLVRMISGGDRNLC